MAGWTIDSNSGGPYPTLILLSGSPGWTLEYPVKTKDDLEHKTPDEIRKHVRNQLSYGKERLIMTTSAGLISSVSRQLVDNYKAWIDAIRKFGW